MTDLDAKAVDVAMLAGRLHKAHTASLIDALRAEGFDISPATAALMPHIDAGGTSQKEIARRLGLTKQAVGQLVGAFAVSGYVVVDRDPTDVRATLVRLTASGLRLRARGFQIKEALSRRAAARIGARRLDELIQSMRDLLRDAEAD